MPLPVTLPNAAVSGLIKTNFYYDRNPLNVTNTYDKPSLNPHGTITRMTYTVPTNRKAQIDVAMYFIQRHVAATSVSTYGSELAYTPVASGITALLMNPVLTDNTVNPNGYTQFLSQLGVMLAGDTLSFIDFDSSTGGNVEYQGSYKILEFDA